MRRRTLTDLASNPDLISGIYNYCDRWCERCPFTSRCLVFATEAEDNQPSKDQDAANAQFWNELGTVFEETLALIPEWANAAEVDLTCVEEQSPRRRKRKQVDNHPLALAGKTYANAAADWFRQFDEHLDTERTNTLREVIQWYQYQIAVKTMRALSGQIEELSDSETSDSPKDSDGSAKVALIGIDRSLAAWRHMQLAAPENDPSIIPLILQLAQLRIRIESQFPDARQYVRPGFDEVPAPPAT